MTTLIHTLHQPDNIEALKEYINDDNIIHTEKDWDTLKQFLNIAQTGDYGGFPTDNPYQLIEDIPVPCKYGCHCYRTNPDHIKKYHDPFKK